MSSYKDYLKLFREFGIPHSEEAKNVFKKAVNSCNNYKEALELYGETRQNDLKLYSLEKAGSFLGLTKDEYIKIYDKFDSPHSDEAKRVYKKAIDACRHSRDAKELADTRINELRDYALVKAGKLL